MTVAASSPPGDQSTSGVTGFTRPEPSSRDNRGMRTKRRTRSYRFDALDEEANARLRRPVQSMVVRAGAKPSVEPPPPPPSRGGPAPPRGRRALDPLQAELLAEHLELDPGHRVLSVGGCSEDELAGLSSLVGPAGCVYDLVPGARAASTCPPSSNRRRFVGEPETLPFPPHRFDACFATEMLQDLPSPARALDEMVRVCTSGGRIVVGELDWGTLVVGDDDRAATSALRDGCCAGIASPYVGGSLVAMLVNRGVRNVVAIPTSAGCRRLPEAEDRLGLAAGLDRACASGRLDRPAARALRRRLEAADAAGGFFASVTGFLVTGTTR